MLTKMFVTNPSDPVSIIEDIRKSFLSFTSCFQIEFMQNYLRDNHGRRPAFNVNQRMELEFLRDQV